MAKRVLKMIGLAPIFIISLTVAAYTQSNSSSHPVEGAYNVESTSTETGPVAFLLILKRDGGKWTAEVNDSPVPLTINSVTVDEANKISIVADAGGTPVTI